ncbi:hypothetical protein ILUMI_21125 [Ignelater luminosus]|uniref:Uncharacterized protein n=1 Tax=Ignelater luminosus TaxID=2038154 RepID=A0A8K0CID1_IGNLU|nr:hypothetical protein ILUMI_21125 [Ignelater luminosus]
MLKQKPLPLKKFRMKLEESVNKTGKSTNRGRPSSQNIKTITYPVKSSSDLATTKDYRSLAQIKYELAPYPLSLLDESGMRKNQKSSIYNCFLSVNIELDTTNVTYIIDGGFLLHHVIWNREETFDANFDIYVHYVHRHYGYNVIIVFDGYNDNQS